MVGMKLLLASFLHPRMHEFFDGEVLYINDAVKNMDGAPFVEQERQTLVECGQPTTEVSVAELSNEEFNALLERCSGVYVASGESFVLLEALKRDGNDRLLASAVKAGLPYAGSSAGAVIACPTIEYVRPMDEPAEDSNLTDFTGLGLVGHCIIPHAQGTLKPYPASMIGDMVQRYAADYQLLLLRDGQALLVDDDGEHLV